MHATLQKTRLRHKKLTILPCNHSISVEELRFSWLTFFKEPCKLAMDTILQLIYTIAKVVQPMHLTF